MSMGSENSMVSGEMLEIYGEASAGQVLFTMGGVLSTLIMKVFWTKLRARSVAPILME
jgi:hypothetical protein